MYSLAVAVTAIAAFAGVAVSQDAGFDSIYKPSNGENVPAGETYTVSWELGSDKLKGPVTITLLAGADSTTLQSAGTIGSANNEDLKFEWLVNATLGSESLYGISIALDADPTHFQYSPGFHIVSGVTVKSSSSASAASSTSSASGTSSTIIVSSVSSVSSTSDSSDTAVTTSTTGTQSSAPTTATTFSSNTTGSSTASKGTTALTSVSSSTSATRTTATTKKTSTSTSASTSATGTTTSAANRQAAAVSGSLTVALMGSIAVYFLCL